MRRVQKSFLVSHEEVLWSHEELKGKHGGVLRSFS